MSNAGKVESDRGNPDKPSPYDVMQAYDMLPPPLRARICNAVLDWDTKRVLIAYRDKRIPIADIIKFLDEQEAKLFS